METEDWRVGMATIVAAALVAIMATIPAAGQGTIYFEANDTASWTTTVYAYRNASIDTSRGLVEMNPYATAVSGRILYKNPVFMVNRTSGAAASFNTAFVFSMRKQIPNFYGDGMTFFLCPNLYNSDDKQVSSGGYLGLFNGTTIGRINNSIFAVEFDTHKNGPFSDPNGNHVGIDVNSVQSIQTNDLVGTGIDLNSGDKIGSWIDYDGTNGFLWVYLAYLPSAKPQFPLIAMELNLTPILRDFMYVGFTSSTGSRAEFHTLYSWWFLSGLGNNLTVPVMLDGMLPPSPPSPAPAPRSTATTYVSVGAAILILLLAIYAARRYHYQKQSQLLARLLLPLACWMYWKESAPDPAIGCSERCLRLSVPSVELIAWFWRRRHQRRPSGGGGERTKKLRFYPRPPLQIVLKRKMGPHYRGEAWQEGRISKRRRSLVLGSNPQLINTRLQSCMTTGVVEGHPSDEKEPLMLQSVLSDSGSGADRRHRAVRFVSRPGSIITAPPSPEVSSAGISAVGKRLLEGKIDNDAEAAGAERQKPPNFGPRRSEWLASYSARRHSVEVDVGFFDEDEEFQKKYAKIFRRRRSILIDQLDGGTGAAGLLQAQLTLLEESGRDSRSSSATPPTDSENETISQNPSLSTIGKQQRRMSIRLEASPDDVGASNKRTDKVPVSGVMMKERQQQRRMSIRLPAPENSIALSKSMDEARISGRKIERQQQRRKSITLPAPENSGASSKNTGVVEFSGVERRMSITLPAPENSGESSKSVDEAQFSDTMERQQQQRRMPVTLPETPETVKAPRRRIEEAPFTGMIERQQQRRMSITLQPPGDKKKKQQQVVEEEAAAARRRSFMIVEGGDERETIITSPRPTQKRTEAAEGEATSSHTWHFD